MDVFFRNKALLRVCSESAKMDKAFGQKTAARLRQRLMELRAADTLADLSHLPPARCHELTQDRAGQFSVDLDHPRRLIFIPADDPVPLRSDGGVDRKRVKQVEVIEITDPHPRK